MKQPLKSVMLGNVISDYVCPECGGDLKLGGFHIDGSEKDLIVLCLNCAMHRETNNTGVGLTTAA